MGVNEVPSVRPASPAAEREARPRAGSRRSRRRGAARGDPAEFPLLPGRGGLEEQATDRAREQEKEPPPPSSEPEQPPPEQPDDPPEDDTATDHHLDYRA